MLTISPRLHVRRPSPTTAEFTVTTSPALTLPLRLLLLGLILLRIQLGLAAILLCWSKWALSPYATPIAAYATVPPFFSDDYIWYTIRAVQLSSLGRLFARAAARVPLPVLLPVAGVVCYAMLVRIYTKESLLVLRGLGIQTSSTSGTYLASAVTRFIPTEKIRDVLVNEAFRGFEVRYYLVVVVDGEDDVVVVFPSLLPKRKIVETVWRGVRGCLYEAEGPRKLDEKG